MDTTTPILNRTKYCGQATVLRAYLHAARYLPSRSFRVRVAIGDHRATCILCRAR